LEWQGDVAAFGDARQQHSAGVPNSAVHRYEDRRRQNATRSVGKLVVTPGDWIITGVKGEHYPCKPDIFEMTYEKVED
jgi:hypothetical protein